MEKHIEATLEAGRKFYNDFNQSGKIVMLNLLRFKSSADYTNLESLKPNREISGAEAYQLYMNNTLPFLTKAGGSVIFYGKSNSFLIGPESEKWDAVLLVEHQSISEFMAFAENKEYLKIAGHRTAALENSRLLPITEKGIK